MRPRAIRFDDTSTTAARRVCLPNCVLDPGHEGRCQEMGARPPTPPREKFPPDVGFVDFLREGTLPFEELRRAGVVKPVITEDVIPENIGEDWKRALAGASKERALAGVDWSSIVSVRTRLRQLEKVLVELTDAWGFTRTPDTPKITALRSATEALAVRLAELERERETREQQARDIIRETPIVFAQTDGSKSTPVRLWEETVKKFGLSAEEAALAFGKLSAELTRITRISDSERGGDARATAGQELLKSIQRKMGFRR